MVGIYVMEFKKQQNFLFITVKRSVKQWFRIPLNESKIYFLNILLR